MPSSTRFQPPATLAAVFGAASSLSCTTVSFVRCSPAGSISHVTRLNGSAAVSTSYSARHVVTSLLGGDASITSPSTYCTERSPDQPMYGEPGSHVDSTT